MNKSTIMINIVAGLGENENIVLASKELESIEDLNISLVDNEDDLFNAFKSSDIDAVIRGSLKASKVIRLIKEYKSDCEVNRATYVNTVNDNNFNEDYEFLLSPVGIDEGKSIDEKITLAIQSANFIQSLGKTPKIAVLAEGRKDDYGRSERIDKSLKESEELTKLLIEKFDSLDNFDNCSEDASRNYEIKNCYILLEQAINDKFNIILAGDGIFGNIMFRTLVLLDKWPSYGAVTLGIDEIFIDTSRDQTVEGYKRSLELAYNLAKLKKDI